jgi:hypothetical protein
MSRRSPYLIELSPDERRELEARARKYTSPYRDGAGQDRVASSARSVQRSHRRAPGYAAPDCEQVAKTLLRESLPRSGRAATRRGSHPLFPPASWFKLRRSPVSFRTASDCPCPGSRSPTSASTLLLKGWSRKSAALACGAGSAAMRCARGNIEAGFSLAIPTLLRRPVASLTCTSALGRTSREASTTS